MTATKPKGRVLTGAAQMQRAVRAAREREKTATKIRAARYDGERDAIVVDLSTGASLGVPRRMIPGFKDAAPRALADIAINPGGESLWSDAVDDGVLLEQLVEIATGEEFLKVLGGRISGRRRSAAKARASRANGAKGGRPPLAMATFVEYVDQALHRLIPAAPPPALSGNSANQGSSANASWRVAGRTLLFVKGHGANEVHVEAAWPRRRIVERRNRAIAERLGRVLARRLTDLAASDAALRAVETHVLVRRARARKDAPVSKRSTGSR